MIIRRRSYNYDDDDAVREKKLYAHETEMKRGGTSIIEYISVMLSLTCDL